MQKEVNFSCSILVPGVICYGRISGIGVIRLELQFHETAISYLDRVIWESQSQEQTQELRLGDGMGDIGKILNAWGQVILRSKQWRSDCVCITGGISVWVLYLPEGESTPQSVDCWIPFQFKWNLPQVDREGVVHVDCRLHYLDARMISARKMMIRAGVGAMLEAMVEQEGVTFVPEDIPEDVHLLRHTYPMELTVEAGEKAFSLEEELNLPPGTPVPHRILYYYASPRATETQIEGDKLVFRGSVPLRIGFIDETGKIHAITQDMPFSQLASLKKEYTHTANAKVTIAVNNLEVDYIDGIVDVRCGIVGQYTVYDIERLEVVEDAYSTERPLQLQRKTTSFPVITEDQRWRDQIDMQIEAPGDAVIDDWFLAENALTYREDKRLRLELTGQCGALYYDYEGTPGSVSSRWELQTELPCSEGEKMHTQVFVDSPGKSSTASGEVHLKSEAHICLRVLTRESIDMICGLEFGEKEKSDEEHPTLILRRAAGGTLWDLAKESRSSVELIQEANKLEGEPQAGQWLLIPVQ